VFKVLIKLKLTIHVILTLRKDLNRNPIVTYFKWPKLLAVKKNKAKIR
jgi:hypothetical protein